MSRNLMSLIVCAALALPTLAQAKKNVPQGHGVFRRNDVVKTLGNPESVWVRGLRPMLLPYKGRVSTKITDVKNPERFMLAHFPRPSGRGRMITKYLAVPTNRNKPVRILNTREINALGLRSGTLAMSRAKYNHGKYGKNDAKDVRSWKVRVKDDGGSGRISWAFMEQLGTPIITKVVDNGKERKTYGVAKVRRSVPIIKGMNRGETAHPIRSLLKVEPSSAKK
jgi:hypothetical protein